VLSITAIDGYITNLNISPGEYANEGQQVFAIVESSIWYVMANFKETYLSFLEIGDTVEVYLMAQPTKRLRGRIQGIGWALYQDNGATNVATQLPNVAPTLDWVRLAQRFPVRIVLEDTAGETLRMGETAAVIVLPGEDSLPRPRFEMIRAFFDWLGINH
jgi:multidrug efflux system membrane fusion protein